MVTGCKCRKRTTFVERSVEGPDTFSRNRRPIRRSSNAFNQLPRSRLERVVGKRSASNQSVPHIGVRSDPRWHGRVEDHD